MRRVSNTLFNLLLVIVSTTLFFLSVEGFVRFYDNYIARTKIELANYDYRSRLEGYTLEKKPGVFRILALGDSIAFGFGVKREENFCKITENLLNANKKEARFEVINTGVPVINTITELGILLGLQDKELRAIRAALIDPLLPLKLPLPNPKFQTLPYDPDLILLQYEAGNDAFTYEEQLFVTKRQRFGDRRTVKYNFGNYAIPLPENIDKWLTRHSKSYMFLLIKYHRLLTRLGLRDEIKWTKELYMPNRGWNDTRQAIDRIGQIAKAYNMPIVMVIVGPGAPGQPKNKCDIYREIYQLIEGTAEKSGFRVINLEKLSNWPKEDLSVSLIDGHPNEKGHRIMAETIYEFLRREKLVP